MDTDFSRNLKLLCSYYKSIAEVCRRLQINRPQFNRYLYGRSRPSANTLRRFCDFFGVEEFEIMLPHDQFQRLIQVRPQQSQQQNQASPVAEHMDKLLAFSDSDLEKYVGYYFEYYYSFACPGQIMRTLITVELREGKVFYQRVERLQEHADERVSHNKYYGLVMLTDRLFMVDYESVNRNELTQTILFPCYKSHITRLSGLKMGVADNIERMPCAARVVYEYLGRSVDIRKALKLCGLYDPSDQRIEESLKSAIDNSVANHEWHLRGVAI